MDEQMLNKVRNDAGFIAALDQSGGSTPKALRLYGIEEDAWSSEDEMFDLIHQMRTRIMTSPVFDGDRILGAILFIGNIVVTAAWMILAVRTGQRPVVHFSARMVTQADMLFTVPGVLLILLNGLRLSPAYGDGNILGASWVQVALVLLVLSGVVWAFFLLRYQNRLVQLSASGEQLSNEFLTTFRLWGIWGAVATVLPIISLVLMVFKPRLWG